MPGLSRDPSHRASGDGIFAYTARGKLRWGLEYRDPTSGRWKRKVGFELKRQVLQFKERIDKQRAGLLSGDPLDTTFDAALKEYLAHRKAEGHSARSYEQLERWWLPAFSGRALHTITTAEIRKRLEDLTSERDWSPQTRNNVLHQLTGLLTFAMAQDPPWILRHATSRGKVPLLEVDNARERWLSAEEVAAIAGASPGWLADIVRFAAATGMRLGEVCDLRKASYHRANGVGWLAVRETKSGQVLRFPLTGWVAQLVARRAQRTKTPDGRLFPGPGGGSARMGIKRNLPAAVQAAGLHWGRYQKVNGKRVPVPDGVTFHTFRHTMASHALQAGATEREVMELGNWRDPRMLRRYAHLTDDARREAAAKVAGALARGKLSEKLSERPRNARNQRKRRA